jgi:OmpA-OmpF porin, OOP family
MDMLNKVWLAALLGGAAIVWSAAGNAQMRSPDIGFYVGGALGQSKDRDIYGGQPDGISCDDSDLGWKIFGGYQFSPNFAAEVAYTDLGETQLSDAFDRVTFRSKAWEAALVAMYPFPEGFTLYGKLGMYRGETKAASTFADSEKESNNDVTFGFGGRYDFNRNFAVRVEWQRYADVGGDNIGTSDIDIFSVGALWKF